MMYCVYTMPLISLSPHPEEKLPGFMALILKSKILRGVLKSCNGELKTNIIISKSQKELFIYLR